MLNIIWLSMIFLAVVCGIFTNRLDQVVLAVTDSAKFAFNLGLGLTAMLSLWLGIMRVASDSGLINKMSRLMRPIVTRIFPDVPVEHPAMGAMVMCITANLFGLGNAATPFALQAMKELQTLNTRVHTATDSMCMFVVLNASSLQLIPTTAIAYLAVNGSQHPSSIIVSSLLCTSITTLVAFILARQFAKFPFYRIKDSGNF
jgi:spore maturation protein A